MIAGVLVVLTFVMSVHCVDEYLDGKVLLQRKGNLTSFDTDVLDYYQEDTPLDELWAQGDTVKSDQPLTIEHYERKGVGVLSGSERSERGHCFTTSNLQL